MLAQELKLRCLAFIIGSTVCASLICGCNHHAAELTDSFAILTPPAPQVPRINGAKVFGATPGKPFAYQIAATGERPMEFTSEGLPAGLTLDPATGQITGVCTEEGEHLLTLRARNSAGSAERALRIVIGDQIALTPPMGWNSWNIWSGDVSQEKVLAAAHAMESSRLRDHGWSYINIDDGWQGLRGGEFNAIQPNEKFPDIAALANEVHALGLKCGLYATPWRTSFLGHIGSSADNADGSNEWIKRGQHDRNYKYKFARDESFSWFPAFARYVREKRREPITRELRTFGKFSFVRQDVAQWSAWGIDYLKYDWVPVDGPHAEEMGRELRGCGRDVVYSLANNTPFSIAPQISALANSWRTSGDVKDDWSALSRIGFSRDRWAQFQRPGHFNDADMLLLGEIGWGKPRPTKLTPNEQYTQMSLWCLLGAPLLLGCDLEKLDAFTLGLLTNDEVLAIDQDSLCRQATSVARNVYAKPLEDGSWAIGLFNRGTSTAKVTVRWRDLHLTGTRTVRDLWRQKDRGEYADAFAAEVPPHGVVLIRVSSR